MVNLCSSAVRIELSVCEGIAYLEPCAGRNTLLSLAPSVCLLSRVATPLREGCGHAMAAPGIPRYSATKLNLSKTSLEINRNSRQYFRL